MAGERDRRQTADRSRVAALPLGDHQCYRVGKMDNTTFIIFSAVFGFGMTLLGIIGLIKDKDKPENCAKTPPVLLFLVLFFWAVIALAVLTAGGNGGPIYMPWGWTR